MTCAARMEDNGGMGAFGETGYGEPNPGRVRNLQIAAGAIGSATVSFEWDGDDGADAQNTVFYLIVNGVPTSDARPLQRIDTAPLGEGVQDLEIVAHPAEGSLPLDIVPDACGNRVLLRWARNSAADVVAYRVYWDDGAAESPQLLLATIDEITVDRVTLQRPTTGVGLGRITIGGIYTGAPINGTLSLNVLSADVWNLTDSAANILAIGTISPENTQQLYEGLTVTWHDALGLANYGPGDSYAFGIGPRSWFISDSLDSGESYNFAISAVDAAGNESTKSSTVAVAIEGRPDPPTARTIAYNPSTRVVTLAWVSNGSGKTRVYTNWNSATEELDDYILIDGWLSEHNNPSTGTTFTLASGQTGLVRVYIRSVDADGNEDDDGTMLVVNATAAAYSTSVGAPQIVAAHAAAAGAFSVDYVLPIEDGLPSALRVWYGATDDFSAATSATVAMPTIGPNAGLAFLATYNSVATPGGSVFLWMQAQDGASAWTEPGAAFGPVVLDSTAPTAPATPDVWTV